MSRSPFVVDDVLATGGTVGAAVKLIRENFSVVIEELVFLMELDALKGRAKLPDLPIYSAFHY